jgi:hypothetical protein
VMGPMLFAIMKLAPPSPASSSSAPPPDAVLGMASAIYVVMGAPAVISGVLCIIAGIKNLKFRSRTLGMVALGSCAASVLTCYCLPTGIGLMVYGLIVYINDQTAKAFELGEQGMTTEQVHAAMNDVIQGRPGPGSPPARWDPGPWNQSGPPPAG